jgi:hypothetical protein
MATTLQRTIAIHVEEADGVDLARLDDDGGARQQSTVHTRPPVRDARIRTPMIPGAREPGMLTTFGVIPRFSTGALGPMDAATIAAHQREGGGAPSERRPAPLGSGWQRLKQLVRVLITVKRR